jgi:hypothetical protein
VQPSFKTGGMSEDDQMDMSDYLETTKNGGDTAQTALTSHKTGLTSHRQINSRAAMTGRPAQTNNSTLRYMTTCKFQWPPQKMTSDSFSNVPPLIGRMPTPLTVSKMISLDRNFSKEIWVPTNRSLHEMCSRFNASPSAQITIDKKRGKFYQRLSRNKKK